jgi:hypothetical protein
MLQSLIATWGPIAKTVGFLLVYVLLMVAFGHRSQIDAWCERNPRVAGVVKLIRGTLPFDPWLIVQGLALIVLKRLPANYYQAAVNIVPPEVAAANRAIVTAPPTNLPPAA